MAKSKSTLKLTARKPDLISTKRNRGSARRAARSMKIPPLPKVRPAPALKLTRRPGNEIVERLQADWRNLRAIDKGRLLRGLVEDGWKKRELARELGCHESLVRQLIDSAKVQQQDPTIARKKAVRIAAQERQAQRQQELSVAASERTKRFQEWLKELVEWVRKLFPLGYREKAIREFQSGPYSFIRQEQFANAAPKPHEIRPGANAQQIIKGRQQEGEIPSYGPDLIEYGIEWYARWGPRVMYDKSLREEVLAEAGRIFERER